MAGLTMKSCASAVVVGVSSSLVSAGATDHVEGEEKEGRLISGRGLLGLETDVGWRLRGGGGGR